MNSIILLISLIIIMIFFFVILYIYTKKITSNYRKSERNLVVENISSELEGEFFSIIKRLFRSKKSEMYRFNSVDEFKLKLLEDGMEEFNEYLLKKSIPEDIIDHIFEYVSTYFDKACTILNIDREFKVCKLNNKIKASDIEEKLNTEEINKEENKIDIGKEIENLFE